jgi:hypothetical protein
MAKPLARSQRTPESLDQLNACVSAPGARPPRPLQKEATFREWVVQNQIGVFTFDSWAECLMYLRAESNKEYEFP